MKHVSSSLSHRFGDEHMSTSLSTRLVRGRGVVRMGWRGDCRFELIAGYDYHHVVDGPTEDDDGCFVEPLLVSLLCALSSCCGSHIILMRRTRSGEQQINELPQMISFV